MVRTLIAFDVIIADTIEEFDRLIQQRMDEGWERRDLPKNKVEQDAMTGIIKFVYWQDIAKYAPLGP